MLRSEAERALVAIRDYLREARAGKAGRLFREAAEFEDPFEFADAALNNLDAVAYALNAGMPVIGWKPAQKNSAETERVLRAMRQFNEQVRVLLARLAAGEIGIDQFYDALVANYIQQSTNSFTAGWRAVGNLSPVPPEEFDRLDDALAEDIDRLEQLRSEDLAGMTVGGLIAAILLDPTNYLGSGLPGDPFAPKTAEQRLLDKRLQRYSQYGANIRGKSQLGEMAGLGSRIDHDSTMVWWVLGPADHCIDCIRLSDASPFWASTLAGNNLYPGSGHTRCGAHCACGLEYDIPSVVCADPFSGPGLADFGIGGDFIESLAEPGKVRVFIQEASSCATPLDISGLNRRNEFTKVDDRDAFHWDTDLQAMMAGDLATNSISWKDLLAYLASRRTAAIGRYDRAALQRLRMYFAAIAEAPPLGIITPAPVAGPLPGAVARPGVRVSRIETAETKFDFVYTDLGSSIRFEGGAVTEGLPVLQQEFTLRALNDLAELARRRRVPLTINRSTANDGMRRWLDTLGADTVGAPPSGPLVAPRWPEVFRGVNPEPTMLSDDLARFLPNVPEADRELLHRLGVRVSVADMGSPGWVEPGTFYDPSTRIIHLESGTVGTTAATHEAGHALDHALGWPSQTDAYKAFSREARLSTTRGERAEQFATAYQVVFDPRATPMWWRDDLSMARIAREARLTTAQMGLVPKGIYAEVDDIATQKGFRGVNPEPSVPALVEAPGDTLDEVITNMGARKMMVNERDRPDLYMKHPRSGFTVRNEKPAPSVVDRDGPPRIQDKVPGPHGMGDKIVEGSERPPEHFFRAISEEDWQNALQQGFLKSDGRMNLAGWEGTVVAYDDPSYYLPGNLFSTPLGEHPGRIVRIRYREEDGWLHDATDGYAKTRQPVPIDRIDMVSPQIVRIKHEVPSSYDPSVMRTVVDTEVRRPLRGVAPEPESHLRVHVPADALPVGTNLTTMTSPRVNGQLIRGEEIIAATDPRIPETVYHVTTNLPAVRASGYLRGSGEGGLGGDATDRIVSMTADRGIAEQLAEDLRLNARIWQLPPDDVPGALLRQAELEGWGDVWRGGGLYDAAGSPLPHLRKSYSAGDWLTHYFNVRTRPTGKRNPIIFGDAGRFVDPANVGVVDVPKANLDNGALLVDFDMSRDSGLKEIRSYGDVSLSLPEPRYRGAHHAPGPDYGARGDDLTTLFPEDIYSPNQLAFYGTGDDVADRQSFALVNRMRGKPDEVVTVYRAVPPGVETINPGDWVTTSRSYAETHLAGPLSGEGQIIAREVRARELIWDGNSINEWGWHPVPTGGREEVEALLREVFPNANVDLSGMDVALFRDILDELAELGRFYPEQARWLKIIRVADEAESLPPIFVRANDQSLTFRRVVVADEAARREMLDQFELAKPVPGGETVALTQDARSLMTHEFGHVFHHATALDDGSVHQWYLRRAASGDADMAEFMGVPFDLKRADIWRPSGYARRNQQEHIAELFTARRVLPRDQWHPDLVEFDEIVRRYETAPLRGIAPSPTARAPWREQLTPDLTGPFHEAEERILRSEIGPWGGKPTFAAELADMKGAPTGPAGKTLITQVDGNLHVAVLYDESGNAAALATLWRNSEGRFYSVGSVMAARPREGLATRLYDSLADEHGVDIISAIGQARLFTEAGQQFALGYVRGRAQRPLRALTPDTLARGTSPGPIDFKYPDEAAAWGQRMWPMPEGADVHDLYLHPGRLDMTPEQFNALNGYAGGDFAIMNRHLRGDTVEEDLFDAGFPQMSDLEEAIAQIDSVLKKMPVPEDVVVWRGISKRGLDKATPQEAVGRLITERGFMSTSLGPRPDLSREILGGKPKDYWLRLTVPKGTPGYFTRNLSAFKDESELLLGRGLTYRITHAEELPGGKWVLDAQIEPVIKTADERIEDVLGGNFGRRPAAPAPGPGEALRGAIPDPAEALPAWPELSALKRVEVNAQKQLGGVEQKRLFTDPAGNQWMAKLDPEAMIREVAASRLGRDLGLRMPPVTRIEMDNLPMGLQPLVPGSDLFHRVVGKTPPQKGASGEVTRKAAESLTAEQMTELTRHSVLDFILANTDTHPGNWVVDTAGNLWGIDKGFAFKHLIGASHSPGGFYLTGGYSSGVFGAAIQNAADTKFFAKVHPSDIGEFLDRVDAMDWGRFAEHFSVGDGDNALNTVSGDPFGSLFSRMKVARARKEGARQGYADMFRTLIDETDPAAVTDEWRAWRAAGGQFLRGETPPAIVEPPATILDPSAPSVPLPAPMRSSPEVLSTVGNNRAQWQQGFVPAASDAEVKQRLLALLPNATDTPLTGFSLDQLNVILARAEHLNAQGVDLGILRGLSDYSKVPESEKAFSIGLTVNGRINLKPDNAWKYNPNPLSHPTVYDDIGGLFGHEFGHVLFTSLPASDQQKIIDIWKAHQASAGADVSTYATQSLDEWFAEVFARITEPGTRAKVPYGDEVWAVLADAGRVRALELPPAALIDDIPPVPEIIAKGPYKASTEMVSVRALRRYIVDEPSGDEAAAAMASMGKVGVVQPLVLDYYDGKMLLRHGASQVRAAEKLGVKYLPARVVRRNEPFGAAYVGRAKSVPKPPDPVPLNMRPSQVLPPTPVGEAADVVVAPPSPPLTTPSPPTFVTPDSTTLVVKPMPAGKKLGGMSSKQIYVDPIGGEWLVKPKKAFIDNVEGGRAAIDVEAAVTPIAQRLNINIASVNSTAIDYPWVPGEPLKRVAASIQPLVPGIEHMPTTAAGEVAWDTLSDTQLNELLQHQMLDWFIGNDDGHIGQFLIQTDGHMIGIDKDAAFWELGSQFALGDTTPENGKHIVDTIWRGMSADRLKRLKAHSVERILDRIDDIGDAEYVAYMRPHIKALMAHPNGAKLSEAQWEAAFLARKQNMRADFTGYYLRRLEEAQAAGVEIPTDWKAFLRDGGFREAVPHYRPLPNPATTENVRDAEEAWLKVRYSVQDVLDGKVPVSIGWNVDEFNKANEAGLGYRKVGGFRFHAANSDEGKAALDRLSAYMAEPGHTSLDDGFWRAMGYDDEQIAIRKQWERLKAPVANPLANQPPGASMGWNKFIERPVGDPIGPPKKPKTLDFKPADHQMWWVGDSPIPLNAPRTTWSGNVPPEPPMPAGKATQAEIEAANAAAAKAMRTVDDVLSGRVQVSWSWREADRTKAEAAGLVYESYKGARLIGHSPADFEPLKAYLDEAKHSVNDDAFWKLLGYSLRDLDAIDTAYDLTKNVRRLTAGVMMVEPDGRIWVLAPRNEWAGYQNTVVKGGIDKGETPAEAAVREVREETGFSVELDAFLGDYKAPTGITRMYIGHRVGGGPLWAKQKETGRMRLMTRDEAKAALTQYGKPNARDQAILADTITALDGTPGLVDFSIPADDVGEFAAKIAPPRDGSTPGIRSVPDTPVEKIKLQPGINPEPEMPVSTTFAYDHDAVVQYNAKSVDSPPSSVGFPYHTTRYKLENGETGKMFWKTEAPSLTGQNRILWANAKQQVSDPHERFNIHVAQVRFMAAEAAADASIGYLRVNELLLEQVPQLRELLIAAGAKSAGTGKVLDIDRNALIALGKAIADDTPLPTVAGYVPTAPLNPTPRAVGLGGYNVKTVGSLVDWIETAPIGEGLSQNVTIHPVGGGTASLGNVFQPDGTLLMMGTLNGVPADQKLEVFITHLAYTAAYAKVMPTLPTQIAVQASYAGDLAKGLGFTPDASGRIIVPLDEANKYLDNVILSLSSDGWAVGPLQSPPIYNDAIPTPVSKPAEIAAGTPVPSQVSSDPESVLKALSLTSTDKKVSFDLDVKGKLVPKPMTTTDYLAPGPVGHITWWRIGNDLEIVDTSLTDDAFKAAVVKMAAAMEQNSKIKLLRWRNATLDTELSAAQRLALTSNGATVYNNISLKMTREQVFALRQNILDNLKPATVEPPAPTFEATTLFDGPKAGTLTYDTATQPKNFAKNIWHEEGKAATVTTRWLTTKTGLVWDRIFGNADLMPEAAARQIDFLAQKMADDEALKSLRFERIEQIPNPIIDLLDSYGAVAKDGRLLMLRDDVLKLRDNLQQQFGHGAVVDAADAIPVPAKVVDPSLTDLLGADHDVMPLGIVPPATGMPVAQRTWPHASDTEILSFEAVVKPNEVIALNGIYAEPGSPAAEVAGVYGSALHFMVKQVDEGAFHTLILRGPLFGNGPIGKSLYDELVAKGAQIDGNDLVITGPLAKAIRTSIETNKPLIAPPFSPGPASAPVTPATAGAKLSTQWGYDADVLKNVWDWNLIQDQATSPNKIGMLGVTSATGITRKFTYQDVNGVTVVKSGGEMTGLYPGLTVLKWLDLHMESYGSLNAVRIDPVEWMPMMHSFLLDAGAEFKTGSLFLSRNALHDLVLKIDADEAFGKAALKGSALDPAQAAVKPDILPSLGFSDTDIGTASLFNQWSVKSVPSAPGQSGTVSYLNSTVDSEWYRSGIADEYGWMMLFPATGTSQYEVRQVALAELYRLTNVVYADSSIKTLLVGGQVVNLFHLPGLKALLLGYGGVEQGSGAIVLKRADVLALRDAIVDQTGVLTGDVLAGTGVMSAIGGYSHDAYKAALSSVPPIKDHPGAGGPPDDKWTKAWTVGGSAGYAQYAAPADHISWFAWSVAGVGTPQSEKALAAAALTSLLDKAAVDGKALFIEEAVIVNNPSLVAVLKSMGASPATEGTGALMVDASVAQQMADLIRANGVPTVFDATPTPDQVAAVAKGMFGVPASNFNSKTLASVDDIIEKMQNGTWAITLGNTNLAKLGHPGLDINDLTTFYAALPTTPEFAATFDYQHLDGLQVKDLWDAGKITTKQADAAMAAFGYASMENYVKTFIDPPPRGPKWLLDHWANPTPTPTPAGAAAMGAPITVDADAAALLTSADTTIDQWVAGTIDQPTADAALKALGHPGTSTITKSSGSSFYATGWYSSPSYVVPQWSAGNISTSMAIAKMTAKDPAFDAVAALKAAADEHGLPKYLSTIYTVNHLPPGMVTVTKGYTGYDDVSLQTLFTAGTGWDKKARQYTFLDPSLSGWVSQPGEASKYVRVGHREYKDRMVLMSPAKAGTYEPYNYGWYGGSEEQRAMVAWEEFKRLVDRAANPPKAQKWNYLTQTYEDVPTPPRAMFVGLGATRVQPGIKQVMEKFGAKPKNLKVGGAIPLGKGIEVPKDQVVALDAFLKANVMPAGSATSAAAAPTPFVSITHGATPSAATPPPAPVTPTAAAPPAAVPPPPPMPAATTLSNAYGYDFTMFTNLTTDAVTDYTPTSLSSGGSLNAVFQSKAGAKTQVITDTWANKVVVTWANEVMTPKSRVLRVRKVDPVAPGNTAGANALLATLSKMPKRLESDATLIAVVVDKKAIADLPLIEKMLKDAGWKETAASYTLQKAKVQGFVDSLIADKAPWMPVSTVPQATPAQVTPSFGIGQTAQPVTPATVAAGPPAPVVDPNLKPSTVTAAPLQGLTAPQVAAPSFIYGYDPHAMKVADAALVDEPLLDPAFYTTDVKANPTLLQEGVQGHRMTYTGATGSLEARWSVSKSGKAVGWTNLIVSPGMNPAERRDAAFAILNKIMPEALQREKFFVQAPVYDQVPGLRQMFLDAGASEESYPVLGTAFQLNAAQTQAVINALQTDTMGGLKVSIKTTTDYIGFEENTVKDALKEGPTFVNKPKVEGPEPWFHRWTFEKDTADVQVVTQRRSAEIQAVTGSDPNKIAAVIAEMQYLADQGVDRLVVHPAVVLDVPKLDKWLLSVGARVDEGNLVLDAVALNAARKYLAKNALPELLGGAKLPYSVVDEMNATVEHVVEAVHSELVSVEGTARKSTFGVTGAAIETHWTKSATNIYWNSIGRGQNASIGQMRTGATAQLRSFLNEIAQNGGLRSLDFDAELLDDLPMLRAVLLKFGGKDVASRNGANAYVTLERSKALKLRSVVEGELAKPELAPASQYNYVAATNALVKWPTVEQLTESATPLAKAIVGEGQTPKRVFIDTDGNEWLFKPGASGRGGATDRAVAQLAEALGLPVPPVRLYTLQVDGAFVQGSLQKLVPGKTMKGLGITTPAALTETQTVELFRHSVLDWVVNNDDAHVGNWLIGDDGKMWALDKTRSWVSFGGSHDVLDTMSNGQGGPGLPPWLFLWWREARANPALLAKIHPQTLAPTLRALRNLSNDEFMRIVDPVARLSQLPKYRGKPEALIADMIRRKEQAAADFERYFQGEIKKIAADKPGAVPQEWVDWANTDGTFNLDATPRDLYLERKAALDSKYGVYSPNAVRQLLAQSQFSTLRSVLGSFFGGGAPGSGSGKWGGEKIRKYLADHGTTADAVREWEDINAWAILNVVEGSPSVQGAYYDDQIRRYWNPDSGTFRLIRSTDRFGNDPKRYIPGYQKVGGMRDMISTSIGGYHTVGAHGAYVWLYMDIPYDQVFSSVAVGYPSSTYEDEFLVTGARTDQIIHIRPNNDRLPLDQVMSWAGPVDTK